MFSGVLAGYLADLAFADPRRGHPVAGFGWLANHLERYTYRDSRAAGGVHTAVLVSAVAVAGLSAQRGGGARRFVATAAATWAALGGTSLGRTGEQMADLLAAGDDVGARRLLPSLCGRDPESLDSAGLARAALESVAENTSDAQVAPLMWAMVGGAPAVLVYRAVNTLDAMIGHRNARYRKFGWAAARLDDAANYLPARATAALVVLCAPIVHGSPGAALWAWRRDSARHPSPNAGVVEAAFAGALGIQLGGPTRYAHELEIRPLLGTGSPPDIGDLRRAVTLSRAVQAATVVVPAVAIASRSVWARSQRRRP